MCDGLRVIDNVWLRDWRRLTKRFRKRDWDLKSKIEIEILVERDIDRQRGRLRERFYQEIQDKVSFCVTLFYIFKTYLYVNNE